MRGIRTCFHHDHYPLLQPKPQAVKDQQAVKALRDRYMPHAGLWHDKFLSDQESKDERARREQNSEESKKQTSPRTDLIEIVSELPTPAVYRNFFQQWQTHLQAYGAKLYEARATGRIIVGLGIDSVLETGIALHHTYGLPYIPGSSLKGLTASYLRRVREKLRASQKEAEQQAMQSSDQIQQSIEHLDQVYNVLFGNTDDAGYITFFDALYIPDTKLKGPDSGLKERALYPDIITVHHQQYYQRGSQSAPADWDSPIPVPFLSATGRYLVALAAPALAPSDQENSEQWLATTASLLGAALKSMGIGAKTSSGYGRMILTGSGLADQQTPSVQPVHIYERPKLPSFREGQEIKGVVVPETDELRASAPEAKAFLRYESFALKDVVIIIIGEDVQGWAPGNTRNCLILREEIRNNRTVLVCRPQVGKKKKTGRDRI